MSIRIIIVIMIEIMTIIIILLIVELFGPYYMSDSDLSAYHILKGFVLHNNPMYSILSLGSIYR